MAHRHISTSVENSSEPPPPPPFFENLIEVRDLWVKYRGSQDHALKGVNFKISEGEVVGIIGPTAAGKTTLAKAMCGLIPHLGAYDDFRGQVVVGGLLTADHRPGELSQKCGIVLQDYETQLFRTTAELEVAFGPENLSLPRPEIHKRVERSLQVTELTGFENRYTFALSGGQKQRLAIASTLSSLPNVLVMDESTSDLDPLGKHEVYKVIRSMLDQREIKALVLIDHHLDRLYDFVTRIIVLKNGQIIKDGLPREVFSDIELLESSKLATPETAKIFHGLGLKAEQLPMTVQEALTVVPVTQYESAPPDDLKPPQRENAIEMEKISFFYDPGTWVITNISLSIARGESVGLIGQNGSGQTTLAQLMMGILLPKKGKVRVLGRDVTAEGVVARGQYMGYVFQNPDYQIFNTSVREELAYGPVHANLPKEEVERRVNNTASLLGIASLLDEDPFFLGKADRQRVAVASVLTLNPKIIILDEPTTGLSPGETTSLMELARDLNRAGTTLIVISHDMWVITKYCERTILLSNGEIVLDGATRSVFSKSDLLQKNHIRVPQVVELSQRLFNQTYLTPEEFVDKVKLRDA
jgi:energy-coupling factor transporter ATP-binding protein EcfA2